MRAARRRGVTAVAVGIMFATVGAGSAGAGDAEALARARGWGYLIDKLVADGMARERVSATFGDPRMPAFDGLSFSLEPRESKARYRRFLGPASLAELRRCRERHASTFEATERAHGVPASIVAAIIHVESGCGRNTGSSPVTYRLARLAMAAEPANLAANLARHLAADAAPDSVVAERVRARARYLEDTFYPEVVAIFTMAERSEVDPLAVRGSPSGAFGYPQFLPSSYLRFGVDADQDGEVSLYDMPDAAASCARYLREHGWRSGMSYADRRAVVWEYNRSDAYIDTVLTLARRLEEPPPAAKKPARRSKRVAGASRRS